jgi:putative glutamine amidotransferase
MIEAGRRPVIGITTDVAPFQVAGAEFEGRTAYHKDIIRQAGGVALYLPPHSHPEEVLSLADRVDALFFGGGYDLSPELYGQKIHPKAVLGSPELDDMEGQLIQLAIERRIPSYFGCRGMQRLNVALGGSLHQYIPDAYGEEVDHLNEGRDLGHRHDVTFTTSSLLRGAMGCPETIAVNSYHKQAIDRLGDYLKVVAKAPDGVIEAIESTRPGWFAAGFQWHEESMGRPESVKLFQTLVDAARDPLRMARAA